MFIIGIDLGTSNSAAAVLRGGQSGRYGQCLQARLRGLSQS